MPLNMYRKLDFVYMSHKIDIENAHFVRFLRCISQSKCGNLQIKKVAADE